MSNRSWVIVGALVAGVWLVEQFSASTWGQQASTPDAPATEVSSEEQQLNLRYAQAYLNLMEVTLRRYDESNQPRRARSGRRSFKGCKSPCGRLASGCNRPRRTMSPMPQEYIAAAQAQLNLAEESLRKAEAANKLRSGSVNADEVARLAAQRDLAVVRLEKARHLASESPLSNVRYELDQLREEVGELKLFVALLACRIRESPRAPPRAYLVPPFVDVKTCCVL